MIENDIILLRKIDQEDQGFYLQIYTDEKLMKFVSPVLSGDAAKKSFEIVLNKMSLSLPTLLLYVIYSKALKSNIGVIGLRWKQASNNSVEIGVMVLEKFQRQGLAHKAKSLLINYAFHEFKLECIAAICDKDNTAANCANQKLGFTISDQTGNLPNNQNKEKNVWLINK